jgi:hypothetical protein
MDDFIVEEPGKYRDTYPESQSEYYKPSSFLQLK